MNPPRSMQRRRYAERIPGAVSEILRFIDDHDMWGRYAGKWRSHPNGYSIGLQHQHSLSAQSDIGFANAADVGANAFSYNLQRRPLPGLGRSAGRSPVSSAYGDSWVIGHQRSKVRSKN